KQLWNRALSFLDRGRPGDTEHTRAVVENGRALLAKEGGNPRVVIPALILHDVGWSQVDFSDFITAPGQAKTEVGSIYLHMGYGARIASDILNDVKWDPTLIQRITAIIAVHDIPEEIRALGDLDATLVFEADWLDKFAPARQERYVRPAKGDRAIEELRRFLDMNKSRWFSTVTARELLVQIASGA
ncbi:MAG: HD domain-containing protein, partial [Deltaproteobacteria bacterium]